MAIATQRRTRGNVDDDAALAARHHVFGRRPVAVKIAFEVDREHRLKGIVRILPKFPIAPRRAATPRVRHHDVQFAVGIHADLHEPINLGRIDHIRDGGDGAPAVGEDFLHGFINLLRGAGGADHVCPRLGESFGHRLAETTARAGDHGAFAVEL